MNEYLKNDVNTPNPGSRESSVHYSNVRFKKAKKQAELNPLPIDKVIEYINDFLNDIGVEKVSSPKVAATSIDYDSIKTTNNLNDVRDIVWLKFTKDGYIGVVAVSNDINFDIPRSEEDYNKKIKVFNNWSKQYEDRWKYNTSGIIVHHLGKCWDESFVLLFPLKNIPGNLSRSDVERGIGNYLIDKGVPILDFYSHNY